MNSRANVIYFHEPRYVARLNRKIATHWAIAFHGRVHARFSDSSPPGGTPGSLLPVLPIYPEPRPLRLKMPMVKFTNHQRAGLLEALSKLNPEPPTKTGPPHKEFILFYLAELKEEGDL